MNTMPTPAAVTPAGSYGSTRFNALRHGVLSRHAVLAWEDETEYRALLDALVAEHAPGGPTEEHLVEEIAGIIWRKRRLRMAEAAMYREKLHQNATASFAPDHLASAALMPITGSIAHHASIPKALAATSAETARELRDLKRDQGMTRRAWSILETGGPDAYPRALAALREDTRAGWLDTSPSRPVTASAILLTRTPSKIGSSDIGKNGTRDQSRNWSIARQSGITRLGRRTPRAASTGWLDTKSTWIANWNGRCQR